MLEHYVSDLPVTSHGRLLGTVTMAAVARCLLVTGRQDCDRPSERTSLRPGVAQLSGIRGNTGLERGCRQRRQRPRRA
jgi:hypothetical protein